MWNIESLEKVLNYLRVCEGADVCYIENWLISYWKGDDKETRSIYKIIEEMQEKGIDIEP